MSTGASDDGATGAGAAPVTLITGGTSGIGEATARRLPFWDSGGGPPQGPILTPEDMAAMVAWALGQPATVDVNTIVVRPVGQRV